VNAGESAGLSGAFRPPDRHLDVGAYSLGALDGPEMEEFERHLGSCDACSRRLREFTSLVSVLAELGRAGNPEPGEGELLDRLLAAVSRQRHRSTLRHRVAAVGAAALIAIGPTVTFLATQEPPPPSAIQAAAIRHSAADPGTGVSATVGLTAKQWGTRVDLELTGAQGPRTCDLIAVGKHGGREVIANWKVPAAGYDKKSGPIVVSGATAMPVSDISHFLVLTTQGQQLVRVAA
jgi:hypothetical protein